MKRCTIFFLSTVLLSCPLQADIFDRMNKHLSSDSATTNAAAIVLSVTVASVATSLVLTGVYGIRCTKSIPRACTLHRQIKALRSPFVQALLSKEGIPYLHHPVMQNHSPFRTPASIIPAACVIAGATTFFGSLGSIPASLWAADRHAQQVRYATLQEMKLLLPDLTSEYEKLNSKDERSEEEMRTLQLIEQQIKDLDDSEKK